MDGFDTRDVKLEFLRASIISKDRCPQKEEWSMFEGRLKDFVEAQVTYAVAGGEKPVTVTVGPGGRLRERRGDYQDHMVRIFDGRPIADELSLDKDGFVLTNTPTEVQDFWDPAQVTGLY